MDARRRSSLALLLAAVLVAGCGTSQVSPSSAPSPAASVAPTGADWHDPSLSPATRAAALLAQMTIEEKVGQMTQLEKDSVDPEGVTSLLLGSVLSGGGGAPAQNDAAGWYRMVKDYQDAALDTRLGIPILYGVDAVHGHNNVIGATIFPQQVGLGASHDVDLVKRVGEATAAEMTATGIRWDFGPVVAVPQDVRWGRTYEGYGEDPLEVARMGEAFIAGLQGDDLTGARSALATPKHFAGDGGTAWGSSTTPGYSLDQGVTDLDEPTFLAIHVSPYRAAIDAGARIVMASFSSTGAGKVHGDRHLLTEVLRGDLGFTGFVVSDWAGVDQVDPDYDKAVATSITAGVDMVMVPTDGPRFQSAVQRGLAAGTIQPERIDEAVTRILTVKFEMGLFEHPMPAEDDAQVGADAHRSIAREAVGKSAVLLKTTAGLLPLAAGDGDVLLAGSGANDIGVQSGGWTIEWQGSPGPITPGTTIADDLGARLGDHLIFSGARAIPPGTHARTGIVVVAEPPYAEGVGDSATLALPANDLATIAEVRPMVDRLIVVVLSGRPMMLDAILPTADAVVAAWLPGTEGAGIGDVLFGDRPFTGTTPYTWPSTPAAAPRPGKGPCSGALFPLGYGLNADGSLRGPAACAAS